MGVGNTLDENRGKEKRERIKGEGRKEKGERNVKKEKGEKEDNASLFCREEIILAVLLEVDHPLVENDVVVESTDRESMLTF